MKQKFVFLDVETTGLNPSRDRITEIAVVYSDGINILKTESTLVNPECRIPAMITSLTGITNDMVAKAPKFSAIAKWLIEAIQDALVIGHNVRFDHGFLSAEFSRIGYPLRIQTACTLRLAKHHLKEKQPSYGLGKLCAHLGIQQQSAHRAAADAEASAKLFSLLYANSGCERFEDFINLESRKLALPPQMGAKGLDDLPSLTGVYYFHDESGKIIYVGKALNIRERVLSHFSADLQNLKERRLKEKTCQITFKALGSELIALLFESEEIKRLKPFFNRVGLRDKSPWGIYLVPPPRDTSDRYAELRLINQARVGEVPGATLLKTFTSLRAAKALLNDWQKEHQLCAHFISLTLKPALGSRQKSTRGCFDFQIDRCLGACRGLENPADYNQRLQLLSEGRFQRPFSVGQAGGRDFLIVEQSAAKDSWALVHICQGLYRGFGFSAVEPTARQPQLDKIQQKVSTSDHERLISQYLLTKFDGSQKKDFFIVDLAPASSTQLAFGLEGC